MLQARDVMIGAPATCSPQDSAAEATRLMREFDIGNVLVTDKGRLVGIVTDRDIAMRVTAKALDPERVPVRDVMSGHVQTAEPNWDLDQIATAMGTHQVRRLPIVENGVLLGIVSLSDVALHNAHKSHVARSLKEISESKGTHRLHSVQRSLLRVTLGLGLFVGAVVALNLFLNSGDRLQ